jgi:hypothetical protein
MALVLKDRVRETSISVGTGTIDVLGAVTGYQTFLAAVGSGNTCYYTIYNVGTNEWEVGIGTVGTGTLSRDTVLASSNTGSLVNFSAGDKDVFLTYPAEKSVYEDAAGAVSLGALSVTSLTDSGLTSGRVTFAGTGGLLQDDSDLTFDGTTLSAAGFSGPLNGTVGATTPNTGAFTTATATTGNITTVNATTVDTTNIEVTTLKAKDGTAAGSIADSTGIVTLNSSVLTTTDINGGSIDGTTIGAASAAAATVTVLTATSDSSFDSTGAVKLPVGTTAQQPTGANGKIRFNSDIGKYEGYAGSSWSSLGGGATGGGSDEIFIENGQNVTTSYTIPSTKNAMSTGPITIDAGAVVTVSSGSRWVVL